MSKSSPPTREDLIFPWKARPVSAWRLLPGFLICASILALLAVVFKVTSLVPARGIAKTSQSILLLNPDHPANQTLLNRALDHSALLLGRENKVTDPGDRSLLPLFDPSFTGFEPRLKNPVNLPSDAPRQRLFSPDDLALPPLPSKTGKLPASPAPPFRIEAIWQGELAGIEVISPPALGHLRPRDLARLRFEVAVAQNGRVSVVAPLSASLEDREMVPAFQSALSLARFRRNDNGGALWGEVTFAWQRTDRPARP